MIHAWNTFSHAAAIVLHSHVHSPIRKPTQTELSRATEPVASVRFLTGRALLLEQKLLASLHCKHPRRDKRAKSKLASGMTALQPTQYTEESLPLWRAWARIIPKSSFVSHVPPTLSGRQRSSTASITASSDS